MRECVCSGHKCILMWIVKDLHNGSCLNPFDTLIAYTGEKTGLRSLKLKKKSIMTISFLYVSMVVVLPFKKVLNPYGQAMYFLLPKEN